MGDDEASHAVEGPSGMVGHGGSGVEGDEADEEALRARGNGIREAGIEEALDEVRAMGIGEFMDSEEEEGPLGMEAVEVGSNDEWKSSVTQSGSNSMRMVDEAGDGLREG